MIKNLIFDLDGTLLNTLADLRDSTNFALNRFGFPTRTTEEIRSFVGNGLKMLIRRAVPTQTDDETVARVLAQMKAHYQEHYDDGTIPYEGVLPFLHEAKKRGFGMAIVSNKADPMVQLLKNKFFSDLIPVAVGEMDTLARKPAPDLVELALKRLGADRESAVYIGDSEVDIQTAKNAKLPCFTVGWGFREEKFLLQAGADVVYRTPEDLLQALIR